MARGKYSRNIIRDIVDACADRVGRDAAVKGVRMICRYFGGGIYYVPAQKTTGGFTKEMYEILGEGVGEHDTSLIIEKIMALYGGIQLYIPFEKTAFRDVIAEEIYKRHTEEGANMRDMGRDYGITFSHVYRLWKKGRKIKLTREQRT